MIIVNNNTLDIDNLIQSIKKITDRINKKRLLRCKPISINLYYINNRSVVVTDDVYPYHSSSGQIFNSSFTDPDIDSYPDIVLDDSDTEIESDIDTNNNSSYVFSEYSLDTSVMTNDAMI